MASIEHQIRVHLKILRPKENDVVIVEYPPGCNDALREIRRCAVEAKEQLPDGILFILLPHPYTMQAVENALASVANELKRTIVAMQAEIDGYKQRIHELENSAPAWPNPLDG